jgi:hypothetical protein
MRTSDRGTDRILEFLSEAGWKSTFVLDPEKDWRLKNLRVVDQTNKRLSEAETSEFIEVAGSYFPKQVVATDYLDGRFGRRRELELTSVTATASEIPATLFEMAIPHGAELYDKDMKITIRDPVEAEEHLRSVLGYVRRHHRRWPVPLLVTLGCGAFIAISVFVLKKRYRKTGTSSGA